MIFHHMTWPEVKKVDWANTLVVVPLGSTEQHGPHLPNNTDTLLVSRFAEALEQTNPQQIMLAPALWLGHSPHHLSFGATLSAHHDLYASMVAAICESYIGMGAQKVWLLNGHGGNHVPLASALQELKNRYPDVLVVTAEYWNVAKAQIQGIRESGMGGMGHACELETSLYLYINEANVRQEQIKDDGQPYSPLFSQDMFHGTALSAVFNFPELTTSGAFGRPTLATKEKGERFFQAISTELAQMAAHILALKR